jgi:hypothetical protein
LCEPLHSLHRTAARSIGKGNAFALHSLMDISWIIFIFSDLISKEALILLDTSNHRLFKMEESHNQRNTVASLKQSPSRHAPHHLAHSLCCCKYVCRSWKCLISGNHKVLPQTMAYFLWHRERQVKLH